MKRKQKQVTIDPVDIAIDPKAFAQAIARQDEFMAKFDQAIAGVDPNDLDALIDALNRNLKP